MQFKIIKESELTPEMFQLHPLWAEYYEPEDIDDIVSWGYERESIKKELYEIIRNQDHEHPYYTVPIDKFPPENMRFFTAADLITKRGNQLRGAVMNFGELVIYIFLDNNQLISLSCHQGFKDQNKQRLSIEASRLNLDALELKEIRFRTVIVDPNGFPIEGVFRMEWSDE